MKPTALFLVQCMFLVGVLLMSQVRFSETVPLSSLVDKRPPVSQRTFSSPVIESVIANVTSQMKDADLASVFYNCFPNTLDTTIRNFSINYQESGFPDTFVITGDIPAMWLRDSTCQLWPYMKYLSKDKKLKEMVKGVVFRQFMSILLDSYANAFMYDGSEPSPWAKSDVRVPKMRAGVWEGKFELDSLLYSLKLSNEFYAVTSDDSVFRTDIYQQAILKVLNTIRVQLKSTEEDNPPAYSFVRKGEPFEVKPNARTGMSKSYFRASDDHTTYLFNVAENAMAVVELKKLAHIHRTVLQQESTAKMADDLANTIDTGIRKNSLVRNAKDQIIFGYEVDGFGNFTIMDDANVPSLLSLPYLGYIDSSDPLYQTTREVLLSPENPFYYVGSEARGIGSPHTYKGWIWPIALIQQALTSNNDDEIIYCLEALKKSAVGSKTYFMHESFDKDDVTRYSRDWFAWANSLFGELILTLAEAKPHLLFK